MESQNDSLRCSLLGMYISQDSKIGSESASFRAIGTIKSIQYSGRGLKLLTLCLLISFLATFHSFVGPPVAFADDCSQARLTGEGQVTSISGPAEEVAALVAQGVVLGADVSFFITIDPKRFEPAGGGVPSFGGKEAVQAFSATLGGFSLDGPATVGCDEFFSPPSDPMCSDVSGASGDGQTNVSIGTTVIQNALSGVAVNLSFAGLWSQDELEHFFNFPGAFTDRTIQFETDSGLKVTADITTFNAACTSTSGKNTTAANFKQSGSIGPVNTFTCELVLPIRRILDLGGPISLFFSIYYASGLGTTGVLGLNWRHIFEWLLFINNTEVILINPEGGIIKFQEDGAGYKLLGQGDIPYKLSKSGSDFILLDPRTHILYTFDNNGRLIKIDDGKGNMLALSYAGGQLTQVTDNLGRTLNFTYDGSGRLISVTDGTRTVSFGYLNNLLIIITDARGETTNFSYDSGVIFGLITNFTLPEGNTPLTVAYNAIGKVTSLTTAAGNVWTLSSGLTIKTITDPEGNQIDHTYTPEGELITFEDATGRKITFAYNGDSQLTSFINRLGDPTNYTYHSPSGKPASVTYADGTVITFDYTARAMTGGHTCYDLTFVTFPDGTTISIEYDANGNPIKFTDQSGKIWTLTYNARGQVLTITNPLGGVVIFTYNADGTRASLKDPAGNTTTYDYDGLKRLIQVNLPDGNTLKFTYDANNNLLTMEDENGNVATYTYDMNNNVSEFFDANGDSNFIDYNAIGKISKLTDPPGNKIEFAYNPMEWLKQITNQKGEITSYAYDPNGNLNKITDATDKSWTATHDAEGKPTEFTDPNGNTENLEYDELGRRNRLTSPLGAVTSLIRDSMKRVTEVNDPNGEITTFGRNANGQIISITLPGGIITVTYTFNDLGQVTHATDPNGNIWTYKYDSGGRLISFTDPNGNEFEIEYDLLGRPTIIGLPSSDVDFTYDPAGNLIRKLYSDGTDLNYTYDSLNRLISANGLSIGYDANSRITDSNGIAITRDDSGRISSMTLAPGEVVTYAYDARGLLIQVTDWAGGVTDLAYDDAGRRISLSRPNGVTTTYTHDNDNRLIGINEGTIGGIVLIRDPKGQIISAFRNLPLEGSVSASATNFAYDAASQIASHTYDAMGRLTDDGTRNYVWDLASRLTSYTKGADAVTFEYDGLGNRTARTAGGTTRTFLSNYALGLPSVSVIREGGNDLRYYIHTPGGQLLYSVEAGDNSRRFYHFDEMGNTIFVTDGTGSVLASYTYSPYGMLIDSSGSLDNLFTWQGQSGVMQEGDTGLYYMRARYNDSNAGRFISRDPIQSIGVRRINPYQYAFGNPMRFVDPTGLQENLGDWWEELWEEKWDELPWGFPEPNNKTSFGVESDWTWFHGAMHPNSLQGHQILVPDFPVEKTPKKEEFDPYLETVRIAIDIVAERLFGDRHKNKVLTHGIRRLSLEEMEELFVDRNGTSVWYTGPIRLTDNSGRVRKFDYSERSLITERDDSHHPGWTHMKSPRVSIWNFHNEPTDSTTLDLSELFNPGPRKGLEVLIEIPRPSSILDDQDSYDLVLPND